MGAIGLHIGLPKTGSSAIQAFLQANALALDGLGISYSLHANAISDVAGVPNGNGRALLKYLDPRRRRGGFDVGAFERADFYDLYMPQPDRFCLISSELLSSVDWEQLVRFKEQIADEHQVIVVAMLRNIYDHALSSWNQRVKWHAYPRSFGHFAMFDYNNPQLKAIKRYAKCFGVQQVKVINYDQAKQDIIGEFFRALDVAAPSDWHAARVNRGLTQVELAVQMALNRAHHDARLSKAMAQLMVAMRPRAVSAKPWRPQVARLLAERFRPEIAGLVQASGWDLAWMLERRGPEDDGLLAPL